MKIIRFKELVASYLDRVLKPKAFTFNILNSVSKESPGPQNALNIFSGEWFSRLPEPYSGLNAGQMDLFEDERIKWFFDIITKEGITIENALDLGPLEGGHSYMLEKYGARSITAIESNTRAYLKCLILKEILGMERVHFLCGNFIEYLKEDGPLFDLCIASGVLYHMQNPAELIYLLSRRCTGYMFIWTNYYDEKIIASNPRIPHRFSTSDGFSYKGFDHTLYRQVYRETLNSTSFLGGTGSTSSWMSREDILGCLEYFGFKVIDIADTPEHPFAPSFSVIVKREQ